MLSPTLSPLNDSAEQMSLHLRRVLIQNRRLLENWEAERAHLEANRARAEEIYREERGIMDEDRMLWAEQEAQYISRIADLERENAALRGFASRIPSLNSRDSSTIGTSQTRPTVLFAMSLDSASNNITPNHGLGHTMPESHPFEPLDPRMQGVSPQTSTPGDGPAIQENTPSIDVQEVHPDLEGIPLKSTAVKKSTFTDGKPPSPPLSASNVTGSNSNLGSPNSRSSKATPAEVTIETLQAPEASRLVMHAGHTPNHSMSTFSTAIFTNASNTAGSSGTSTPIHSQRYPTRDAILAEVEASNTDGPHTMGIGLPEVTFKPSEHDPELKGPLSLRNQPAFDEIFLAKVGDKLQDSIQTDDATPTVLKHGGCELEGLQPHETATVDQVEGSKTEEHEDVPLKFKFNSNFGAPLGAMHGF